MIMSENRRVDRRRLDPDRVLDLLHDTGLTGHGGGGFPTATKIAAARGRRPDLIINACDGEPLVHKDTTLLRHRPLLVADGVAVLQALVRPRRTLIAVHQDGVRAAAEVLRAGGVAGEVLPVPPRYVSSEASALASLASGGEGRPLFRERPLTMGAPVRGHRPTLVLNAETTARIAATVLRGGAIPTRVLSLAGDLHRPSVIEVPLDSPLDAVISGAGPVRRPRAVLVGGYGGRWFDVAQLAGRTVADLGRDLGAGLIMVHADGCPLRVVAGIAGYLADQTAGQCGPCMFGLPAIAADWQQLLDPRRAVAAEQRLRRRMPDISGRGACHHPDGTVAMVASALAVFGADVSAHRSGRCVGRDALAGLP